MSNLGQFTGNPKNASWGRTNNPTNMVNPNNAMQQQLLNQGMSNSGMLQFQQQQVFQNALGMQHQNLGLGLQQSLGPNSLASQMNPNQIFQQVGAVSYPNPRGLNTAAFSNPGVNNVPQLQQQNTNAGTKQRVFTGTVTKVHDNFGFVDEDVFFHTNACVKGSNPIVGDRVLVEASYNPTMPFKWNATRIQVLPNGHSQSSVGRHSKSFSTSSSNVYTAVPPPDNSQSNSFSGRSSKGKGSGGRGRERSRDRDRDDEENERKKRREERLREREKEDKKSPVRRRSRSPKARRRSRIVPRYMVQIPKIVLSLPSADVLEVRRRYTNLYVPSDFFHSCFRWIDAFPPHKQFSMNKPCQFQIMNKEADNILENDAILEPPDADYLFSAKVMLMSVPGMEDMYQKCCAMAEDSDKRDSEDKDYVHPSRLINFLVGLRGKNETMAIGGPWSPSLDGAEPAKDPSVLIKTAIRTCKALTGIDLSNCTQWYRFVELYYRRSEAVHKGKAVPARVETVVIFLPDVWSCLPTRLEWDNLALSYRQHLDRLLSTPSSQEAVEQPADEKEDDQPTEAKLEPTHYSLLDPKTMVVSDLRNELNARSISSKGLKSQLVARLSKALKSEANKNDDDAEKDKDGQVESETEASFEEKKMEVDDRKIDEKEKAILEKRYTLPDHQHILVHPSKTAKSGKFDCTVMSLSLLLDYRPEDTKEHSFEVSIFAELFNEMLMRDFGFNIFKALHELPDKSKDEKEKKKDEKDDKKREDKKKDDKGKEKDKSEEKKKDDDKKSEDGSVKSDKKDKETDKKSKKMASDSENEDDHEEDDKEKKKDRSEKKKRVKLYTKNKHLLLSFVYFDQTHCGYIFDKDVEDLLYTLGLSLSRAQVKKLTSKVIARDSLHYRKLTDKSKEEESSVGNESETDLVELALGNNNLLPVFKEKKNDAQSNGDDAASSNDGMVMFQGALVDVSKLISQLERSEKARVETEAKMVDLKNENTKLQEKYSKVSSSVKHVNQELKEYKEKLVNTEETLSRNMAYSKLFQTTLVDIREKIDPVLKTAVIKEEKRDKDDKKFEDSKSRWEKEQKQDFEIKNE